ncbi:glycosyltransferase family 4 protein [bacterium SCSIO 12643]|nr:glycosyltransferase family 4 protein [bacterium SCSIO 12643]
MKIAVNTRLLLPGKLEGIGWFTYETLKRITESHPEHEFLFLFDRQYSEEFIFSDNVTPIIVPLQARHPILYYIWFEWLIPPILRKNNVDLFLSPDGYLSLNSEKKQLAVIHDINFEYYPRHLPWFARKYYRFFFPKFSDKAKRIATVSQFSKEDLIRHYEAEPEKIDVVYNGVSDVYKPVSEEVKKQTRDQHTQGAPYFIFIGSIQPRKNLTQLFKAFDLFKKAHDTDIKLLIVGEKRWWTKAIRTAFDEMQFQDDVIFSGRLEQKELSEALASALALVYVSFFEGFGIPIVESMNCNVPVITSNVTSMPEVAGKAGVYVSPFDSASIREGMEKIAFDQKLVGELIEAGKVQREKFSWDKTAQALWNSIEKCVYES